MLRTQKISPRTGKDRTLNLEKWISREKDEIKRTKQIIAEAKKKTEDIIKEAHINGDIFKQMMSEKVATPREGLSVRSGMNSERRKYQKKHKQNYSDNESDHYDFDKSSVHSKDLSLNNEYPSRIANDLDQKEIDDMIEKFGNKEIDLTRQNKNGLEKADNEGLMSVETPKIESDDNSAFDMTNKIMLGPQNTEGDSSQDSKDDILKDKRPISLEFNIKSVPSDSREDQQIDLGAHSLSRKKSEHRLTEIDTKLPKDPSNKVKSTVTPTPISKPSILNPFNSDNFFTQNFDDQEMEAAIEQLKNSSGKMGLPSKGDGTDSVDVLIDHKEFIKRDYGVTPGVPNFPLSSKKCNITFRSRLTPESRYQRGKSAATNLFRIRNQAKKSHRMTHRRETGMTLWVKTTNKR